ncbi:hypothetical protein Tco_0656145 [Tanacetum coccineum]|uniref:Uncharacterized protein n=1 Tax=Tanacetum coccineum TaxID=301880 RepID=A0ABQ4X7Z5_9ASTR
MALLAQSFKATLPQTNNQLRTSSNTRNQATIQDGRVVVQNVQGRHNQNQRYLAQGNDVDNQPVQDLALNEDNIFQVDECDAFDLDVDDEPICSVNTHGQFILSRDEHEIHNKVQPSDVIDTTSVHMGNSNVIPYEQYLLVNNISDVPSCASSALNSVCISPVNDAFIPHEPIATELKIYKEQVAIYEQRAKFELTEREQ